MWSNANRPRGWRQVPSVQIGSARGMTTGQDQTQTLDDAANGRAPAWSTRVSRRRRRGDAVLRRGPRLPSAAPTSASCSCRSRCGSASGSRAPALVLQDRAILVWGRTGRTQIIPRKRPGGVTEIDVQSDAITLWIDCEQPLNVRVQRFEGTMDVPTTFADMLRPDGAIASRPPSCRRRWSSARTASASRQGRRHLPALRPLHRREAEALEEVLDHPRAAVPPAAAADPRRDPAADRRREGAGPEADPDGDRHRRSRARSRPRTRSAASPARAGRAARRAPSRSAA